MGICIRWWRDGWEDVGEMGWGIASGDGGVEGAAPGHPKRGSENWCKQGGRRGKAGGERSHSVPLGAASNYK